MRHSHEHFDGSGYPGGVAGEAIPLASRILLVADAYDAITSDRPYRSAQSQAEALQELRRNAGHQFDPQCVDALEKFLVDSGLPRRGRRSRRVDAGWHLRGSARGSTYGGFSTQVPEAFGSWQWWG